MFKKSLFLVGLIIFSTPNASYAPDECDECMQQAGSMACTVLTVFCILAAGHNKKHETIIKFDGQIPAPQQMGNGNLVKDKNS